MIREMLAFDWDRPVSPDEREALLEKVAGQVVGRGLQTPAIWMLAIHAPLMPLMGQLGIALGPTISIMFAGGASDWQPYTKLMREPGATDDLIALIEQKTEDRQLAAR